MKPASIALLVVFVALALFMALDIRAAAAPVQSEECPLVGNAGGTNIYRCADWEMGKVCYVNGYGFLFCLDE